VLEVVPARTQVRRRRRTIALVCGAVMTLLTVVGFHALLAQSQVALDELERRTAIAERRYENARYEYAQLSSPARITEAARQMGMVPPGTPPTPVLISGEVPPPADAPSTTMNGWTEVKPTLGDSP
jgi:cell division protein FtsL